MSAMNKDYATPASFRILDAGQHVCGNDDYSIQMLEDSELGVIEFKNGKTIDLTGRNIAMGIQFLGNFETIEIISGSCVVSEG